MITELQARRMTNEQILETIRKACNKHNQKLIHAQYNPITLGLTILVDRYDEMSYVDIDMDNVLIGLWDMDLNPSENTDLQLVNEPFCPATILTHEMEDYYELADATGGIQLV